MKRAIEEYFPIIDINRLAVPERNAFKPIYQMHKWFARRSSSVFRAILLGALKPAGTDIMTEFYKDHTNDPDTKGKVILDPFMGGGTTVVEALRLGCKVIGIDLNPVAWFIVKTEVEPVDIEELKKAFDRLANRTVEWSGKPLKETLLSLYKTECPACGNNDADIIYTFWVKSAPCTTATCKHETPLFSDYIIAQKAPSIRHISDYKCPHCAGKFDWEREPAALVGDAALLVNSSNSSAGIGRGNCRWVYSNTQAVDCPWCNKEIVARFKKPKLKRKKVPLSVLYCPQCEEVWQYRGELPDLVECPTCSKRYNPHEGNIPEKGKFLCQGDCGGNKDTIIAAIRKLPDDQLLPIRPYGIEGYCPICRTANDDEEEGTLPLLPDEREVKTGSEIKTMIWKNSGKFFKRISAPDLVVYKRASETWQKEYARLPYPISQIPLGEKTKSGLLAHHYRYWHQMFNARQLLALSTLLKAIDEESVQTMKEMLLSAFHSLLNDSNMFTWYQTTRDKIEGIFTRHDYQPKMEPVENNVFGVRFGKNTWIAREEIALCGKEYNHAPYDRIVDEEEGLTDFLSQEKILANGSELFAENSARINIDTKADCVITDPPYGGNVNYAELADFFYVWLRLPLRKAYPWFEPEYTPKADEVIENRNRGKSSFDFKEGLRAVFKESNRLLDKEGLLVFTFHHAEGSAWESLLEAVCESAFYVESVYPIHGEAENSPHLIDKEAISYDLVHVCRKSLQDTNSGKRSWTGIRNEIRKQAREEIALIQAGRYGRLPLSPADTNILLIGKCLELYSKHYGKIVDHEDKPVPIRQALEEIKMLVDQIVTKEDPLPGEIADIDIPSYIYFTTLYKLKEIKADDVSKSTRGIIETGELRSRGLIIKGREKRGRTFEVKQPAERLEELKRKFHLEWPSEQLDIFQSEGQTILPRDFIFVDVVHLLLGLAESGENLLPWLERFRGLRPQIRAALEYLAQRNPSFEKSARIVLGLMDERALVTLQMKNGK